MLITYLIDWLRRLRPVFSTSLPHVATYTRELPISLERMYENAIDGEHLPWLHRTSFSHLEMIESGPWGWRAKGNLFPKSFMNAMEVELRLDKEKHCWITRTVSGLGKGNEVWTHAFEIAPDKIKIVVDFYVPKLPKFLKSIYAKQLVETYATLYDEDLWMMATRQQELNRIKSGKGLQKGGATALGQLSEVENKLPLDFDFNNHPYQLIKVDGKLTAYARTCPHMLGPLEREGDSVLVSCPWHGYQFDIITRECVSGAKCKLAPAPAVTVSAEQQVVIS